MQKVKWDIGVRKVYGPYFFPSSGRIRIEILYWTGDIRSIYYSRYLMEQKLQRRLKTSEHVDHIDGDKTNDNIANLQILTNTENLRKIYKDHPEWLTEMQAFECPQCEQGFLLSTGDANTRLKRNRSGPFCSYSCASKYRQAMKKQQKQKIKAKPKLIKTK